MRRRKRARSGIARWLKVLGLLTCGLTIAGFAGTMWWPLDLASHFRVQYLAYLTVAAMLFLLVRRWRWAGLFGLFAAVNLGAVAPMYVGERPMIDGGAPIHRVMLLNVQTANRNYGFVRAAIEAADPDLVILQEVDSAWLEAMATLEDTYRYRVEHPRSDNFGLAMYSRLELSRERVESIGSAGLPTLFSEVRAGPHRFLIVGTHPLPPTSRHNASLRNEQLERLGALLKDEPLPVLLVGDLNVTPFSTYFRKLCREGDLQDSSKGRGVQPSWPAGGLPLLIPIDHCLVSEGIAVVDRQVGPNVSSDHYPIIVDFQLRP